MSDREPRVLACSVTRVFARVVPRALVVAFLLPGAALAQAPDDLVIARGLDFERQGRYEEAAGAFHQVLSREPTNAQALLGAERVYAQLGRRDSVLALAGRALAADSANTTAWTVAVRGARAMGGESMAAAVLGRWMAAMPRSEAPYRELVRALVATSRFDDARDAVRLARTRLGNPGLLRPELAGVEAAAGRWPSAAAEWRAALVQEHDLVASASFNLLATPAGQREAVIAVLTGSGAPVPARRVAAELLLGWSQPEQAWTVLRPGVPAAGEERRTVLQAFVERARALEGRAAQRVAAEALDSLAVGLPPAEAARVRIESARAWAAAGDPDAARRLLREMASDPGSGPDVARAATAALVELAAREGNVTEAARLLEQQRDRLPGTEAERLGLLVARGWIRAGDLDRAAAAIAADSSLAAEDVRGWIALYRGDLADARTWLREGAGAAIASGAGRSVERAAVLTLLQAVRADSSRELGEALYQAARGDTARAARGLVELAHAGRVGGEAELLEQAARYAAAAGDTAQAERLWTEIVAAHAGAPPAPGALLALAELSAGRGDRAEAIRRLETLILDYPASALVPEARRELERLRGTVPPAS